MIQIRFLSRPTPPKCHLWIFQKSLRLNAKETQGYKENLSICQLIKLKIKTKIRLTYFISIIGIPMQALGSFIFKRFAIVGAISTIYTGLFIVLAGIFQP